MSVDYEKDYRYLSMRFLILDAALQDLIAIFARTATPEQLQMLDGMSSNVNDRYDEIEKEYGRKEK